jgi:hypothetical protein
MVSLEWLAKHRFQFLERREHDWVFSFDGRAHLTVSCLWRLLEGGQIKLTSEDDGHWFGLGAPIEAVTDVNRRLATASVESVTLRQGTLDVQLQFSNGLVLEILPDSAGYEAWTANDGSKQLIAVGGGELIYDP